MNYRTETRTYNKGDNIDAAGATDIEFFNAGLTIASINGRILPAGETYSINGFPKEKNTTIYKLNFVGNTGTMCVTRRVYDK